MNLTLMVKYRAIEQSTPVLETFRLGTMESITRELRLSVDPTSYDAIRNALLCIVKETREKEHAYRQVIFPGDELPDGSEADTIYIVFSKAYVEFLEHARLILGARSTDDLLIFFPVMA